MILPSFTSAGEPWTPVDCAQRSDEVNRLRAERGLREPESTWPRYVRVVRQARPGEGRYVPHPFPTTDAEVLADFRYAYFERLFDDQEKVPQEELLIYQGLREGTLELEVARVENWLTTRCIREGPAPFFHVLTVTGAGGRPLSRAALYSSGIFASYAQLSPSLPTSLLPLDDVADFLARTYGLDLPVTRPQYAALGGMPNDCGELSPCVVFKSAGRTFVLGRSGEALYELPPNGARRSIEARREEALARGLVFGQKEYRRPWLTVGFEWARAELIAGQDRPHEEPR